MSDNPDSVLYYGWSDKGSIPGAIIYGLENMSTIDVLDALSQLCIKAGNFSFVRYKSMIAGFNVYEYSVVKGYRIYKDPEGI